MRFRKIHWGSWWWLGELCEVPRCRLWRGLSRHCSMYKVSCIFFNKCFYFSYHMAGYLQDRIRILHEARSCVWFTYLWFPSNYVLYIWKIKVSAYRKLVGGWTRARVSWLPGQSVSLFSRDPENPSDGHWYCRWSGVPPLKSNNGSFPPSYSVKISWGQWR